MMTFARTQQRARMIARWAGGVDLGTGLGLVFWPRFTLALMRVPVPGAEGLRYAQFVGVFVAAVGFSYWWELGRKRRDEGARARGLQAVLRFTIPFRVAAGTFCLGAVMTGGLAPMWLSVTMADYGLVVLQAWLLQGKWQEVL